jgi:hypothetical protein
MFGHIFIDKKKLNVNISLSLNFFNCASVPKYLSFSYLSISPLNQMVNEPKYIYIYIYHLCHIAFVFDL